MRQTAVKTSDSPTGARARRSFLLHRADGAATHVLVAAGDPLVRETSERQLLSAGLKVSLARTAFEAIVKASCHLPDLIVLDGSLGRSSVAETIQLLTTCPVTAHIPIVRSSPGRGVSRRFIERLPSPGTIVVPE